MSRHSNMSHRCLTPQSESNDHSGQYSFFSREWAFPVVRGKTRCQGDAYTTSSVPATSRSMAAANQIFKIFSFGGKSIGMESGGFLQKGFEVPDKATFSSGIIFFSLIMPSLLL
ncbi:hypothetical protein TNCT_135671 [Trichonephila clavata]|uniref:Uncharacterized protein n=1 Tax=Trichonephila clavata TaxID=2740835 RepID=A0A8X6KPR2_TRICU|nr:hypothetical protein TNCT_135671 [Trichonephila clavata]